MPWQPTRRMWMVWLRSDGVPVCRKSRPCPAVKPKTTAEFVRWPQRLGRESLYRVAYPLMFLSRSMEERLLELFQKGYVKGTVTFSTGNEATAIGMSMPLRPGRDVLSLLHRDLGAHLLLGATPYQLLCQYMANADSPTHACEGNVHHGDAAARRFPMISHLGKMLSVVVGGTWAAPQRRAGLRPGGHRRRRHQHRRVPRIAQYRLGPQGPGPVSDRKQPLCLFHAHQRAVQLPAALRPGRRLRHLRPHDRRHRSVDGLLDRLRSDRRHGRVVVAGIAGVRHASPVRSCRL